MSWKTQRDRHTFWTGRRRPQGPDLALSEPTRNNVSFVIWENEVVLLWKRFAVYCTGYLLSKFHDTTCGTFLCRNENPKSSDSRHAWLWQPQTKLYWICTEGISLFPFSMYTGPQSIYTERTINKRETEWLYDRAKLGKEHFRPEDSVKENDESGFGWRSKGTEVCLLKNLDKACGNKE